MKSTAAAELGAYEGMPESLVHYEDVMTIGDCLSSCKYTGPWIMHPFDDKYQTALLSAGTGVETGVDTLLRLPETCGRWSGPIVPGRV